jgi:two-component system, sensor histidine kinase LadS
MHLEQKTKLALLTALTLPLIFCIVLPSSSWAQKPESNHNSLPSFSNELRQLELPAPMGVLVQPTSILVPTPEQLLQQPLADQFVPWHRGFKLPTSKGADVWLRLDLPQQNPPTTWILRIPRVSLHKATLFEREIQDPARWHTQATGTDVPNVLWPSRARSPQFELTTRADQTQTVFVRLQNNERITEDIQLVSSSDIGLATTISGSINGMFIGVFSMLTLLGLASWRLFKNPHFGWFALLSITVMLAVLTLSGFMNMRVWSSTPSLSKLMIWVAPFTALAAFVRLVMSITYMKDLSKRLYAGSWAGIAVCCAACIYVVLAPLDVYRPALAIVFAAILLLAASCVAWIAWRSQSWLWAVVLCMVPAFLAVMASLAYGLGWDAPAELITLMIVITTGLALIATYMILVSNQLSRRKAWGHENLQEMRDASTKLWTKDVAMIRFEHFIARSQRFHHSCGAVLVRWNDIQKLFAHANAISRGSILAELGQRLARLGREIDTVARYDDNHFLFLVEAPITETKIRSLAGKILASCMRPYDQSPEGRGFDVHIAVWLYSQSPCDQNEAIKLLFSRLVRMNEGTQRRVRFVNAPDFDQTMDLHSDPQHGQALITKINAIEQSHHESLFDKESMDALFNEPQKQV